MDPGNTGSRAILRTLDPGNTGSQSISRTQDPGNTGSEPISRTLDPGNTGSQAILRTLDPEYIGQDHFSEAASRKTLIKRISLNSDKVVSFQKRRAPKFHAFWRAARAEISHMRPIQARKLKLINL